MTQKQLEILHSLWEKYLAMPEINKCKIAEKEKNNEA